MEPPDPIFRGGPGRRWHALFSSWLPTLVYCPGDLPVVNESCHPYSQCARKCARCPKVENSVASEPSKSTSQCIAVCTKRRSSEQRSQCAARSSRDLSAQPGAARSPPKGPQEPPGGPHRKSCLIPFFSPAASKSFAYPLSFCII